MFQRTLIEPTWQMGRNIVLIGMAGPLQNLLNTLIVVVLEKVSSSNTENPKTVG